MRHISAPRALRLFAFTIILARVLAAELGG